MTERDATGRSAGKRDYRLGKRAQKLEETRRRIVEATVDLHGTVGPAKTTISDIAARAGVQRHTVYAHFPDERSLFLACSGLSLERDPLPDVERLQSMAPGRERVREILAQFYRWFDRNIGLAGCVLRDSEHHALTREMIELRMEPIFDRAAVLIAGDVSKRAAALVPVAMDFACWRALSKTAGPDEAAELMTDAMFCLG